MGSTPITNVDVHGGCRVAIRQNGGDGDGGDNHNHNDIKEVIDSNNEHPGFPVITGRLQQPVNRR